MRRVSIHAPTRGATRIPVESSLLSSLFQSTHPHGVRLSFFNMAQSLRFVFQSTHPHGVRHLACYGPYNNMSFNPRTHTGCDYTKKSQYGRFIRFNPRTHTGCDGIIVHAKYGFTLFQSTHPHGVRRLADNPSNPTKYVSIHAPTRGATGISE